MIKDNRPICISTGQALFDLVRPNRRRSSTHLEIHSELVLAMAGSLQPCARWCAVLRMTDAAVVYRWVDRCRQVKEEGWT
jgi:hypothetical protein